LKQFGISFIKLIGLYPAMKSLIHPVHLSKEELIQRIKMQDFYSQFIKKRELCFDVGAHVGGRTEVFLRLGAKVVAIEPQETCFRVLHQKIARNRRVALVNQGLSDHVGFVNMHISNASTISTMSEDWKSAVTSSNRFPLDRYSWTQVVSVPVTTLDQLIERYGLPAFIKIDVEGYELHVLRGLSQPVRYLSFEHTPEFIDSTRQCVNHISGLGMARFNFSLGESMQFSLSNWVVGSKLCDYLSNLPDKSVFGDVYARFGD
jgi:FkbM family methyltransferase